MLNINEFVIYRYTITVFQSENQISIRETDTIESIIWTRKPQKRSRFRQNGREINKSKYVYSDIQEDRSRLFTITARKTQKWSTVLKRERN